GEVEREEDFTDLNHTTLGCFLSAPLKPQCGRRVLLRGAGGRRVLNRPEGGRGADL
ncbi:uncharacterized, partial [Tachysurus ichikawai]